MRITNRCRYCGACYPDREHVQICESRHQEIREITPRYIRGRKYPVKLTVRMSDGTSVTYFRVKRRGEPDDA